MDLGDVRIALAVAREGSLAAASQHLGISQPTMSKAIARLERANRITLFELIVHRAGGYLSPAARKAMDSIREAARGAAAPRRPAGLRP